MMKIGSVPHSPCKGLPYFGEKLQTPAVIRTAGGPAYEFLGIFPLNACTSTARQQLFVRGTEKLTKNEVTHALPCHYVLISDMRRMGCKQLARKTMLRFHCAPQSKISQRDT